MKKKNKNYYYGLNGLKRLTIITRWHNMGLKIKTMIMIITLSITAVKLDENYDYIGTLKNTIVTLIDNAITKACNER